MKHIEDTVLATLITRPDLWAEHGAALTTDDFTDDRKAIFAATRKRVMAGQVVDQVVISGDMEKVYPDCAIHETDYASWAAPHRIEHYIEELKRESQTRLARKIGLDLAETGDVSEARRALDRVAVGKRGFIGSQDASAALMEEIERRSNGESEGLKFGLAKVDRMLTMEPGDLCVIAARPSMGKSALMLNVARRCGVPVGIFSVEMPTSQLMGRMVAMQGVDYGKMRHPKRLTDSDWPLISEATKRINEQGMWINDTGGISIDALESDAYRMVREHGVKLICVDYLQIVTCKAESRLNEISEISRRLKAIAKNLSIPVIVLSQLSRAVETRGGEPIPRLSDLRESGQIEQDADQVVFIYRPSAYKENVRPGEADIYIGKSRNDITGKATVCWQGQYQRFVDLAHDNYPRAAA